MKGPTTVYVCQECGARSSGWLGQCSECDAWHSLVEKRAPRAAADDPRPSLGGEPARRFAEVDTAVAARVETGVSELDRVLGGGLVPGSLVLLGGEPGIGKSTLLLQAAAQVAAAGHSVLYCSGEESPHQAVSYTHLTLPTKCSV